MIVIGFLRRNLWELDDGDMEVVCVSSVSGVVWCSTASFGPMFDVFRCEGKFICRSCQPQRFFCQLEKLSHHASGTQLG